MARFQKGHSGNPNGRPKGTRKLDWCREYVETQGKDKLLALAESKNPKVSLQALTLILAYAYGKPAQAHDVSIAPTYEELIAGSWGSEPADKPAS